jgi:hypothetical protein
MPMRLLLSSLGAPLGGELLVGQSFDKDAAHHAAGLKANLLSVLGVIPIGERDAAGGFI